MLQPCQPEPVLSHHSCPVITSRPGRVGLRPVAVVLGLLPLLAVGAVAQTAEPPPGIDRIGGPAAADPLAVVENLRAFARLYGYVRYFHPSDEASSIDWELFAVHGVRHVSSAATGDDLKVRLEELFGPIAPTVQLYHADQPPLARSPVLTPEDVAGMKLIAWQHRGVGLGNPGPYASVRLHRRAETGSPAAFGGIVQRVDAAPFRGMEIRVEAAVRAEVSGAPNQAQLWLRVDRPDGQTGFFDNMRDRPVVSPDWQRFRIIGQVADDAEHILLGGFLAGTGRAWFDAFELYVRDAGGDEWSTVPLSNARFEAGAIGEPPTGWGGGARGYRVTVTDADAYREARSVVIESVTSQPSFEERPESGALFDARPEPGEVVERRLARGLAAQVPLALYSRDGWTLRPDAAAPASRIQAELESVSMARLTPADGALRSAAVVIAWNIFQHFYPYFDVVDADWDAVLTETLRRAAEDRDARDLLHTLRWMVARLEDGHGNVAHPIMQEESRLPFLVEEIERQAVIVAVAEDAGADACFERGDVVISIDGLTAERALRASKEVISGSPQWKSFRAGWEFGRGERGSVARLELSRPEGMVTCEVVRDHVGGIQEARPEAIERIRDGVYYVDLSRAEMPAIQEQARELADADGIVFDLRGYPRGNHGVLQHLSTEPLRSAHWQVPQQIYPDHAELVGYDTSGRWTLVPAQPAFRGRIVWLTDGRAISYAESVMGIVEHYGLGEIVGRATAGANGNVNPFTLPGGYRVNWTGMRVIKHDGSQHHLVGIQPDVPVERTVAGVRAGRDELLETALERIEASAAGSAAAGAGRRTVGAPDQP